MRRWMFVALFLGLAAPAFSPAFAQSTDAVRGADRLLYDELKREDGSEDPTSQNASRVLQQQARHLIGRLSDPQYATSPASLIHELIRELPIQRTTDRPQKMSDRRKQFVKEFGKHLVAEIDKALKSNKVVVRVNAARALSVVAQMGYDGVAPVAVRVLKDPAESVAVKRWAIEALANILAFIVDPNAPDLSVFTANNTRAEEQAAVQALSEFILQKPKLDGLDPKEVDAYKYTRRQAVKALGFARANRVRYQGQVLAKPGWVLLKVANNDGMQPPADVRERAEAVGSYLQLFPDQKAGVDRDVRCDVAAHLVGAAMYDIVKQKLTSPTDLPWRATAERWEAGLELWAKNAQQMRLEGADAVAALAKQASADLLDPLKNRQVGSEPQLARFREWLFDPAKASKGALFKEDESSAVKVAEGL